MELGASLGVFGEDSNGVRGGTCASMDEVPGA